MTTKAFTIYDRGELGPSQDRFDVFKYTLASYQSLSWEHVVIYAELDEMYAHRKTELEDYIYSLYPNATFYPFRNKHQREWKVAVDKLSSLSSDGLVWFLCNDDHIFIDYETGLVERLHKAAKRELARHPHVAIFPFSWAERICYSDPNYIGHEEHKPYPILERTEDYFIISWGHNDSAQVVSLEVLRKWWFDFDYGDAFKPRTDTGPSPAPGVTDIHAIMPWREVTLHYDGSSNVGVDPNAYPAHRIPEGFFENRIRIQFGGTKRIPGYVWFNPDIEVHASVSPEGVDYRRVIDDIPLFWRNRISEIKVCDERPEEFWIRRRNDAVLRTASQFWRGDVNSLMAALKGVFRSINNDEIPLSPTPEQLNRYSHVSVYKSEPKVSDFAFIMLDRAVQQTAFQTVYSLTTGAEDATRSQIVSVGVVPEVDRAMFPLVSTHIVVNDYDARQLGTYHKHLAWNIGAGRASATYLVFTDSLNIFPPNFIRVTETLMQACDVLLVGARYLTFGPMSEGGPKEPMAIVIRQSQFSGFSEDPIHFGEFGGLARCAAYLEAKGLKTKNAPESLYCWRVPIARCTVFEGAEPTLETGRSVATRIGKSVIYLEQINRSLIRKQLSVAQGLANKIPQFPGGELVRAALHASGVPQAMEYAAMAAASFPNSAQHLCFAAAMGWASGEFEMAYRFSNEAYRMDPSLFSSRLLRLYFTARSNPEESKNECLRLLRMYPLEESLWGMLKL